MGDNTFITVYDIVRQFLFALTFLGAAAVSFLVIQEEKVRGWLKGGSKLLHIVVFLSLTYLVYSSVIYFLNDLLFFPRRLISGDTLNATINCLRGLLVLAGLIVGSKMILEEKGIK